MRKQEVKTAKENAKTAAPAKKKPAVKAKDAAKKQTAGKEEKKPDKTKALPENPAKKEQKRESKGTNAPKEQPIKKTDTSIAKIEKKKNTKPVLVYPTKDGIYTVQYRDEKGWYHREAVKFSKKDGQWAGIKQPEFYDENVTSWFLGDTTIPSESMHRAYKLLGRE